MNEPTRDSPEEAENQAIRIKIFEPKSSGGTKQVFFGGFPPGKFTQAKDEARNTFLVHTSGGGVDTGKKITVLESLVEDCTRQIIENGGTVMAVI